MLILKLFTLKCCCWWELIFFLSFLRGIWLQKSLSRCSGCRWPSSTVSPCGNEMNWRRKPRFSNRKWPPHLPNIQWGEKNKRAASSTTSTNSQSNSWRSWPITSLDMWRPRGSELALIYPLPWLTLTDALTPRHIICAALVITTACKSPSSCVLSSHHHHRMFHWAQRVCVRKWR